MERVDKHVLIFILNNWIRTRKSKRRGLTKDILNIRLVSRNWRYAVEACDDIWTVFVNKRLITDNSIHQSGYRACAPKYTNRKCKLISHYTGLSVEKYSFKRFIEETRQKRLRRYTRKLKKTQASLRAFREREVVTKKRIAELEETQTKFIGKINEIK